MSNRSKLKSYISLSPFPVEFNVVVEFLRTSVGDVVGSVAADAS